MGKQAGQIFAACAHHHLPGLGAHAAELGQMGGNGTAQGFVTLRTACAQHGLVPGQHLPLQPAPGGKGEQGRIHAAGGKIKARRRLHRRGRRPVQALPGATARKGGTRESRFAA